MGSALWTCCGAGLQVHWTAADCSIQVSMQGAAQLVCLGQLAAFANSEFTTQAGSAGALSASQLCAKIGNAAAAKAAEVAKLVAAAQQV